jgi:hypothetical protein
MPVLSGSQAKPLIMLLSCVNWRGVPPAAGTMNTSNLMLSPR